MSSTTSNCLNYKELQAALKVYKNDGLTTVKLNAKQCILQAEYDRLTTERPPHLIRSEYNAPPVIAKLNDNYPFCSNTVTIPVKRVATENQTVAQSPVVKQEQATSEREPQSVSRSSHSSDVITRTLPAMNKKYAPSWLCKPVTVYVVDGIDYLPFELDMALKGETCELTCELSLLPPDCDDTTVPEKADQEPVPPYFIDTHNSRFVRDLGTTELQAARNLEDTVRGARRVLRAVISVCKGFHARQVERASQAA